MEKIENINKPSYSYNEWDTFYYDSWELFENPVVLTEEEYQFGKLFMEKIKIDMEEESIIEFRALPQHLFYFAVNAYKMVNHKR
jgi:hypothetical protein